jgi:hypothetical protein
LAGLTAETAEGIVAAALAVYDFCLREPEDALLLASFSLADVERSQLSSDVQAQLRRVNEPITPVYARLAEAFADCGGLDTVHLVLVDLPFGMARRHVQAGSMPPPQRRAVLAAAVRAALDELGAGGQGREARR